jgi:hypothetical protein
MHDHKGYSEEKCLRCGWVMGSPPLNCNNDDTPHRFPSSKQVRAQELRETADDADTEFSQAYLLAPWLRARANALTEETP